MAKGKLQSNWREKVLEWKASGKAVSAWCKENQIPLTTFSGWKRRFDQPSQKHPSIESNKPFIELKDSPCANSGIFLECDGVKVHLEPGFNGAVLKQCIACLRGVVC